MQPLSRHSITRRRFMCHLAVTGLAGGLAACAVAPTFTLMAVDGRLQVGPEILASLAEKNSAVILRSDAASEAILLLREGTEYLAVGTTCTHQGCPVRPNGPQLTCSCHGSAFARDGAVLRGPAQKPLQRYPLKTSGDSIDIFLPPQG